LVKVNGVQEFRKRNKLRAGYLVELDGVEIEIKKISEVENTTNNK